MVKQITTSIVLGLATATGTHADVISVNLYNSGSNPMAANQYAGVINESRAANWNDWQINDTLGFTGTAVDDGGTTVSGFSVSQSGSSLHPYNGDGSNDGDRAMQSDFIDIRNGETVTWSVSGVPYDEYDVYIYMRDDGSSRAGSFTLGDTTYYARGGLGLVSNTGDGWTRSTDTTVDSGTDIDQGNYVRFEGLSGSSFTMDWSTLYAGDTAYRNKVAGFQIVAIPEPATLTLISTLGIGLLLTRRLFKS